MRDVLILDAVRTPRGRGKANIGALSGVHPQQLFAQTINHLAERTNLEKRDVEDVVVGCVSQANEQGACLARNAVLAAGWPEQVTGVVLNRYCGSGLQAVNFAAMGIGSGFQDVVVAGGVESMSRVPFGTDGGDIDGRNPELRARIRQVPQGIAADLIATREGISRAELDSFGALSQERASRAQQEGRFDRSVFAVRGPDGQVLLDRDEHPRPGTTCAALAALRPAFETLGQSDSGCPVGSLDQVALQAYPETDNIEHVHTAGTSSGVVDGAAAVLLSSREYADRSGLQARGRVVAMATWGTEPVIMLTAPALAARRVLEKANLAVADIDIWEINEAFAVVPLQTTRALGLDLGRVNVNGGAIALGHPLGATGAMLLGTALDELERTGGHTALIAICIGGGMGVATIIERIA